MPACRGGIKELVPLCNILNKLKINVVFKYEQTVKSSLIKNSPTTDSGCVYTIPCKNCDEVYVGQTGKTLKERLTQHKYSVRTGQQSSGVFNHVQKFSHPMKWEDAQEIFKSNSLVERLMVESVLIKTTNNFNMSDGLYKIDNILLELLKTDEKIKKIKMPGRADGRPYPDPSLPASPD